MVAQKGWRPPPRPRTLVSPDRRTGHVLEWKGRFGWIEPDSDIDHPEAWKHHRRVYVNAKDVVYEGAELYAGAAVSFVAYTDGDGVGAEDVMLVAGSSPPPPTGVGGPRLLRPRGPAWRAGGKAAALAAQKGGSWGMGKGWLAGKGSNGGVQHSILKLPAASSPAKGKGTGKGLPQPLAKGLQGKVGGKTKSLVLVPGPRAGAQRDKTSHEGAGTVLSWASSEMQGWRPAMEDAACALLELDAPLADYAMFAVFDGHGGASVSRRAAAELPQELLQCAAACGQEGGDAGALAEAALRRALPSFDSILRSDGEGTPGFLHGCGSTPVPAEVVNEYAFTGSTAVVALLECDGAPMESRPVRVTVANCGDSRAVLCRGGEAVALSEDQKPGCPEERDRIEKAGGSVAMVGPCERIDGWGLNLSRALGDFHYKARDDLGPHEQKVSCCPEVMTAELTEDDEFLLLGCDGVFELQTNQSAVDLVRASLQAGTPVKQAVEELVDACCSYDLMKTQGKGSDNVSALVVLLR